MNKFKSGDKVVRIAETLAGYTVTKGEEYTVDFEWDIDYNYYIGESKKLLDPFVNVVYG